MKILSFVTVSAVLVLTVSPASFAQSKSNPWGSKTKAAGKYADVNGVHLYYEIHGKGQPLILLHGGLGAGSMFGPNLAALAKVRNVIAVDLQGHGRTPDIDRPLQLDYMADDIAALIKHLNIGRCDIMGYSMGAGVALHVAVRHPEVVNKLVVVSAILKRDWFYPEILVAQQQVNAGMAEQMKRTPMYELYKSVAPRPEDWPRLLEKIGDAMKKGMEISDSAVAAIKAKTLIVCGDADIFPPSHAVEMFELLGGGKKDGGWDGSGRANVQLAILPGLTHYAIGSDPALAAVVIPFLKEADVEQK